MNNKGLSSEEVIISRKKYGSNILTKKSNNSFFKLVIEALSDPIIKILLIALAIKILFLFKESNIYETLGIFFAVFLAAFISAISEYGSEKAFEKLNNENSIIKVKVLRDNIKKMISIDELVVGDIVYLESGDKVPADGKIIDGQIYVDESQLTGETKEKHKSVVDSQVFMGTIITEKSAVMKVTVVGDNTYYGKIASAIQERTIESPLKTRLRELAKTISKFGYICAVIILISYLFNAMVDNNISSLSEFVPHLFYGLTLSVAVVVMAVPEGLPMLITLVLSSNMKRMLKRNVLVRKLVGIETAGSLNILFTDKTGTLTEGKLKVISIMDSNFNEYYSSNEIKNSKTEELVYQSMVYNNASFINNNAAEGGNTTDRAILNFMRSDNKSKYKVLSIEEFNSNKKYSKVQTSYNGGTDFIKGAYEIILNMCDSYIDENNNIKELIYINRYKEVISNKMSDGYRVLCMAYKDSSKDRYTLIGFIFIKDNIRKNSYDGINEIKNAGISIVMVTGDSKETAVSVAKNLNIISAEDDVILTGEEFNNMSDEELTRILPNLKVLARSLPQDKNRLVYVAQRMGLIVGMTGDGVNDAPALKKADVGFSMGSGTEVAKETSDIVILDDNIKSISVAILYGRTIFKSIRKFVIFQLSVNVCAVILSVVGPFIGILSPVTVIQVLWINMVMDTLAGLAFAYEPPSKEYMEEMPKKRSESIINKYMINQIVLNGLYSSVLCIWFLKSNLIKNIFRIDPNDKYMMTAFFGLFIFLAIFNAFNARTHRLNILSNILKNKIFIIIISFIAIIQIILIYYGGELFRTTGLTIYEFEIMIFLSFTIIPFDIFRKLVLKKLKIKREI